MQARTWVAPHLPQPAHSQSASSRSRSATSTSFAASGPAGGPPPKPVGGYRNQTLVLNGPGASTASTSASATSSTPSAPAAPLPAAVPSAPPAEIVIGGTTFVADPRGNKLVRKTGSSARARSWSLRSLTALSYQRPFHSSRFPLNTTQDLSQRHDLYSHEDGEPRFARFRSPQEGGRGAKEDEGEEGEIG